MAGRFSVEAVFKAIDRVTAPVSRMQNRVNKFTRSMNRGFKRLNKNVNKFTNLLKKSAIAVTGALAITSVAMANVIGTGMEFEQTLVNAAAKFPGEIRKGTKAFEQLEKAARKTGATTEFTASQSANALNFLAMAGFNAEQSIASLPGVVNLATAASIDLGTAADVATDSLGAFNLMSKDATQLGKNLARVNDVIAKTTTTANTTVESLFETIKDGAPVATAAGASLETFAALAGELANAGIKGSRAGTTLKNMFVNLSAPGTAAAKTLNRLKVSTRNANGDLRDVIDILGDLNGALKDMGTAERAAVLKNIFGKIPLAGVNVLLAAGSKRLREYRTQLEGATGASDETATVMRDTLQGRLNSLKSAIEGVKISIFSMTSGPLSDVVDKMTEWVRANEKLIATNVGNFLLMIINNLDTIVTWIKNISVGLATFFAFSAVLKTLVGILTLVNLVMAANPITLIVIGVVALIAAFAILITWIDNISAGFDKLPKIIQFILAPIGLLIKAIKFVKNNIGVVTGAFGKVSSFLGFGDDKNDDDETSNVITQNEIGQNNATPQIVTPQERVARNIEERQTTNKSEVTIRDETGRAEITGGKPDDNLSLQLSGAF